jgi:hypothetical protein
MTKRTIIILFLTCTVFFLSHLDAEESLVPIISGKHWDQLPPLFYDHSHKTLKNYFSSMQAIKMNTSLPGLLTYQVRFPDEGEIGLITFEKKDGKYGKLEIKNQIKPLYFIDKFKKYRAANFHLNVGDARLKFIDGFFYESLPSRTIILFEGNWQITIQPGDEEEKRTLKRKFKSDYFQESRRTAVFVLDKPLPSKHLTPVGDVSLDGIGNELQPLFDNYREAYGIDVKEFAERWYLPFSQGTNLIIFEKGKKSYYYYSYNPALVPDTQMTESDTSAMILSYNSHKGIKLQLGGASRVSRVKLGIYFNPRDSVISGTTTVSYNSSASVRTLNLAKELSITRSLTPGANGLNFFRRGKEYYIMGDDDNTLSLFFRGHLIPTEENLELFKPRTEPVRELPGSENDIFYFLSRIQDFYPNPGDEFHQSNVTVKLPAGLNCLASGNRVEKHVDNASVFQFDSPGTRGISMVVGNFTLSRTLDTRIPLHFYGYESYNFPRRLDLSEIKEGFDLFVHRFGPLDLSAVNVLLKRGQVEGGISNNGFIVVKLPPERTHVSNVEIRALDTQDKKIFSPILLRDRTEDHILHELAHQWWGGVISWKSYQDVWLTEGLAHFSTLYFLKAKLSDRDYNRILRKLKRWVNRFSDSGPIIYGSRINLLEEKYEAYQSVVYDKSALVFLTLMDMIGEEEFFQRLQSVLEKFKYKGSSTMQFIRQFSGKDRMIEDFLKKWIYSREIPVVELSLVEDAKETDKKEFKRVVLRIDQLETDFIFPLRLKVTTRKGSSIEPVIMKSKSQTFVISRDSTIKTIELVDTACPVRERKPPPPGFIPK